MLLCKDESGNSAGLILASFDRDLGTALVGRP